MTLADKRLNALLTVTTTAFLFVAPFTGSAGLRATTLILATMALVALFVRGAALELDRLPRAVVLAFAAWALLATASLAWTVRPEITTAELRAEVLYGALALGAFLLAARDASRWPAWRYALLLGALVVITLHLVQPLVPFALTRHSVVGQGGLWSTYLVIVAPVLMTLGWPAPWGAGRGTALQAAAVLLLFATAWATGNRAVWAALAAQLVVLMALASAVPGNRERRRSFRRIAIAALLVAGAAFFFSIKDRVADIDPAATVAAGLANDVRPQIWAVAWPAFLEAPWLGHGFGREILERKFAVIKPATPNHPPVEHAHNLFIDMALELGVVGLAALVAVLGALAIEYRRCLRDSRVAPLGVLGLALLAGFVAKNLTDDFLHRHNALVFWALNGILMGLARSHDRR